MSESHSTSPETLDALVSVLGGLTLVEEEARAAHIVAPEIRRAQDAVEHATQTLARAVKETASLGSATDETLRDAVDALVVASRLVERARGTIASGSSAR